MHNQAQLLTFTTAQPEVKEMLDPRDASRRCGQSPEHSAHIHRFSKRQEKRPCISENRTDNPAHYNLSAPIDPSVFMCVCVCVCVCVTRLSSSGFVSKQNLSGCGLTALNPREISMRKMEKLRNDRTLCQRTHLSTI